MYKLIAMGLGLFCTFSMTACGKKDGGTGPSGNGSGTRQLRVSYAGFVGQSFRASAPTLCPTSSCSVTPAQNVSTEGVYTYPVSEGATYVLQGTLVGRPAPLGPPATNVGSALAFSLGWQPESAIPVFGIRKNSVRLFLNDIELPNASIFNGPGCGHYLETLVTPSVTTRWSFIFTVISYLTSVPPDLCA